ncbi:hypothetical protein BFJ63_vAg15225 [Fusarium oxysporum f. sp. narcissi]|uniref:Uncharacterized protein n=1 Tax=Fusarium oxysporum f. sp. narcissi TaxID=451672 RepID=A0A4Q2VAK2_FUSOX|nr:hypothetical protein BFJ63_vAg15225 [Fusarium oxysporum f. sp. narcissi]
MPKYKRFDGRSAHVFRLVVRFYNVFIFLATCLAILSLAVGAFGLFRVDSFAKCASAAVVVPASASTTAILTVVAVIKLESSSRSPRVQYEKIDMAMAWMPFFFLNLVVLEVQVARLLWHNNNCPDQLAKFLVIEVVILLIMATIIAFWVRRKINSLLLDQAYLEGEGDDGNTGDEGFDYQYAHDYPMDKPFVIE